MLHKHFHVIGFSVCLVPFFVSLMVPCAISKYVNIGVDRVLIALPSLLLYFICTKSAALKSDLMGFDAFLMDPTLDIFSSVALIFLLYDLLETTPLPSAFLSHHSLLGFFLPVSLLLFSFLNFFIC